MKKIVFRALLIIQICVFANQHTFAQLEGGITIGAMQYEGDIGGRFPAGPYQLHNPTSKPGLAVGFEAGYKITPYLKVRAGLNFGTIYGSDKKINKDNFTTKDSLKAKRNFDRALDYKSPINEFLLGAELYPLSLFNPGTQTAFQPYLIVGFGLFNFNPKAIWTDTLNKIDSWVELRPLRTEGQGILKNLSDPGSGFIKNEYKLIQTNFSFGLGFKYSFNSNIGIAYEFTLRRTSTDYLDDASGKYIDINIYNSFFGSDLQLIDQARQLSNRGLYYNDNNRLVGTPDNFKVDNVDPNNTGSRGGRQEIINDYYYTNSIKITFSLGNNNSYRNSSNYKYRKTLRDPVVY